ncbi:uncharacterized protein LOC122090586 [Macadamia integrifolia]|uniref:uncharacterized protein LOC122090586 n=1 Tax=Macadamia integrifolia TaxID=60698 RepID=UPI001C4F6AC2|nr:uncharacterized protein LOC122090586 [Macadamia integrifolia]
MMNGSIYLAAFFLNPNKIFKAIADNPDNELDLAQKASDAFNDVLVRLVPDETLQDKINVQVDKYTTVQESFAKDMAIRQRDKLNPISWWSRHGSTASELSKLALRILGLCCSSSGCERNWSTFEFVSIDY